MFYCGFWDAKSAQTQDFGVSGSGVIEFRCDLAMRASHGEKAEGEKI
jgi:hypothetical protein